MIIYIVIIYILQELSDKKWGSKAKRGDVRWVRQDDVLCTQWKDSKAVTVCSTFHSAEDVGQALRNGKDKDGHHLKIEVNRPLVLKDYTMHMGGVDRADHLLASYNCLLKCHRWWKTLFFHLVDLAIVNGFILFQAIRERFPEREELRRPRGDSQNLPICNCNPTLWVSAGCKIYSEF